MKKLKSWMKNNWLNIMIFLALVLIILSLFSPYIIPKIIIDNYYTNNDKTTYENINILSYFVSIGDTIGGITNPFISIAAVIVTGLAFYAQYKANDMVKKQFEIQKFENQFYEMLRLHKENVNEIEIETSNGKTIKGRDAFFEMKKELENLLHILDEELDEKIFQDIYSTFFWGFHNERLESSPYGFAKSNTQKTINSFEYSENIYSEWRRKIEKSNCEPKGYHSYLGHYFRHLFHTVKFVVNSKIIDNHKKLDYLRIFRSQLSNYEQSMIFYNWIAKDYGGSWENDENNFLTEYKIIHNLWYTNLYGDNYLKQKLKELVNRYKELGREDSLFEIGDNIDEKF